MSDWAETRRADRVAAAEQARENQRMVFEQRRADKAADAQLRREAADKARADRAATLDKVTGWTRAHVLDLMFLPVILVPAVLAWKAMADYGHTIFGGPGVLLPLFSEGAMWVFAFAVAIAARANRPTGWLKAGTWVFAAVAAALNFTHGLDVENGGVGHGVVMALVSVGGVVVHQLVHANPLRTRRTPAERAALKVERDAHRRLQRVRRAAVRQAAAQVAADGTATLLYRPGTFTLRGRFGRLRLAPATVPGLPVDAPGDELREGLADEVTAYLAALPAPAAPISATTAHPTGNAETPLAEVPAELADKVGKYVARVRRAIDENKLPDRPSQTEVRKFLRIRSNDAAVVYRVLNHGPDDDGRQEVKA
ncbi:hypothetical protein [Lentzea flaviverrucosa]|uniref:DUF2637 domain-containing protein n=1 Tax=Lentzea flaviverrucosa TaxID=200379 RepID=A0A1H9XKB5_9PSEU|nr:hypothetical protein [Lentzea flaviverrucosa]RDI20330.1 hypothetical protein DFR72_115173 [Lentzea flaviverrucosa]SES46615.1 hypothetical protein SAMN05216195_115173 [Lentzea flaviverrucosa]